MHALHVSSLKSMQTVSKVRKDCKWTDTKITKHQTLACMILPQSAKHYADEIKSACFAGPFCQSHLTKHLEGY